MMRRRSGVPLAVGSAALAQTGITLFNGVHPLTRRLDRSTEGVEWRDLFSTNSRPIVERRSLRSASLREAPVETTVGVGMRSPSAPPRGVYPEVSEGLGFGSGGVTPALRRRKVGKRSPCGTGGICGTG